MFLTSKDPKTPTKQSSHHDLVHQLSLPLEGQVTWLRSPRVSYELAEPMSDCKFAKEGLRSWAPQTGSETLKS